MALTAKNMKRSSITTTTLPCNRRQKSAGGLYASLACCTLLPLQCVPLLGKKVLRQSA
jgi:hypothetical protein